MWRFLALCLAIGFGVPCPARAERLPIRVFSTADGLASTFIEHILHDSRGFVWIGTREGLNRFDGTSFVTYGASHGIPHPTVTHVLETRAGVYWVATNGRGVCRFAPEAGARRHDTREADAASAAPRVAQHPFCRAQGVGDNAQTNRVNVLYEDAAGRVWAGTDGGLFRLDEPNGGVPFRPVDLGRSLSDETVAVNALVGDSAGDVWAGTSHGVIHVSAAGQAVHRPLGPSGVDNRVDALILDREGRLWMASPAGAVVVMVQGSDRSPPSVSPFLSIAGSCVRGGRMMLPRAPGDACRYATADGLVTSVVSLHQSRDGRIWIGTGGGLISVENDTPRTYSTANGLSDNTVTWFAEDRAGHLWMATMSSGLMKLALDGFVSYGERDGLAPVPVHSILEDQDGRLFAVSADWSINRFDKDRFVSARLHVPGQLSATWASQGGFLDSDGRWWLLATRGLYRYPKRPIGQLGSARPAEVYTARDGLPEGSAFRLFEDRDGDIWIGLRTTDSRNVARWDRETKRIVPYYTHDHTGTWETASALAQDSSGAYWIGFQNGGGLVRLRGGRVERFGTADGVPDGIVAALHLDRSGRLWIATAGSGLGRIDDPAAARPRVVHYTAADGLGSNNIRCLTEDALGRIYAGTGRGLVRLDPQTGQIRRYSTDDGLAGDFVTAAFRDRHGALWFGTLRGISRLLPVPERPGVPVRAFIGGLRVSGEPREVSELGELAISGLRLGPGRVQIEIDFFGLGSGEPLQYQYTLGSGDPEWSTPTDQRTVTYAGLAPGSYRFAVRALIPDDPVASEPATVAFTILQPVWQRWWFLAAAGLGLASAAYGAHRSRLARLLAVERVRTRVATDLHDDIGASLSQIAILSEVARHRLGDTDTTIAQPLATIASTSRDLVDSMSDIVWAVDPQKDRLADLTKRIRWLASQVLPARDIEFRFDTWGADGGKRPEDDIRLQPETRRQVFLILKEALNNIVRHAACRRVEIDLRMARGRLTLTVADDGRGFDRGAAHEGHGLENLRRRARALGGTLEIISEAGSGTRLTLDVPCRPGPGISTRTGE